MRLFAAIPLTETRILDALTEVSRDFQRRLPECRWTSRENLHMTVRFYGETEPAELPGLKDRIAAACRTAATMRQPLLVTGFGSFTRRERIIFYLALRTDGPWLADLARELGETSEREFTPHMTIGRLKLGRQSREKITKFQEWYRAGGADLEGLELTKPELLLCQSALTPSGPIYTALDRWQLSWSAA